MLFFMPFKDTTQSYYHSSESCKSESWNHVAKLKSKDQDETKVYDPETEKSRAWDSGFVCVNSTLCNRVQSSSTPNLTIIQYKAVNHRVMKKVSKIVISLKTKLIIREWNDMELRSFASGTITALRAYVRSRTTRNHFISRIVL